MADTVRMSIDIPEEEHRKLKAIAALRGVALKVIILECVEILIHGDGEPNELTKKVLEESDQDVNINYYDQIEDLRKKLNV